VSLAPIVTPAVQMWATLCVGLLRHVAREHGPTYLRLAARLRKHGLAMDGGTITPGQRAGRWRPADQPLPASWLLRPDLHLATPELLSQVRAFVEDQTPINRTGLGPVSIDPLMVCAVYYSAFARARLRREGGSPSYRAVGEVARVFQWSHAYAEVKVKEARKAHGPRGRISRLGRVVLGSGAIAAIRRSASD
jgi:hypothetical protein